MRSSYRYHPTPVASFIAVATDFDLIYKNEYYSKIYNMFSFDNDVRFAISFGVVLISFYIFRSMTKLIISEASNLTTLISSVLFMLNKILQNYHELKREYIILAK